MMDAEYFAKARAMIEELDRRAEVRSLAAKCEDKHELHRKTKEAGLGSRSDDCSALVKRSRCDDDGRPLTGWHRVHRTKAMRKRIEAGL